MPVVRAVVHRQGLSVNRRYGHEGDEIYATIYLSAYRIDDGPIEMGAGADAGRLTYRATDATHLEIEAVAEPGTVIMFRTPSTSGPRFNWKQADEPLVRVEDDELRDVAIASEGRWAGLAPQQRIEQFMNFGDWWFANDDRPRPFAERDMAAEVSAVPAQVPQVLERFYKRAITWPFDTGWWMQNDMLMFNQNRICLPSKLTGEHHNEHGLLYLGAENQGVTEWTCPPGEADPAVYDREWEENVGAAPHPYPAGRCSRSLADFLIGFYLLEYSFDGAQSGSLAGFAEHFDADRAEFELLHDDFAGRMMSFWLWHESILVTVHKAYNSKTKEFDTRLAATARSDGELAALVPFMA